MTTEIQGEDKRQRFRKIAEEAIEIIKLTSDLINEISRGHETFKLYSIDHQHTINETRAILSKIRALFYNRRVFTIDAGIKRFLINGLPIYEVSRSVSDLHKQFWEMKIGGLTFVEGISNYEVGKFMQILNDALTNKRNREWITGQMRTANIEKISIENPMIEDMGDTGDGLSGEETAGEGEKTVVQAVRQGKEETQFIEDPRKIYQVAAGIIKDIMYTANQPDQINVKDVTKIAENIIDCIFKRSQHLVAMAVASHIENYQYTHPVNVAIFGAQIAMPILRDTRQLIEFARIALLYDVGKSHISRSIFNKPEALSFEEFETLQKHPVISAELLDRHTNLEKLAVVVAYEHHVGGKDGGYPSESYIHETNLVTRIIKVSEAFDSLINNDIYRQAIRPHRAIAKLLQEYHGTPEVLLIADLIDNVGLFPCGSVVTLTSGQVAIVVDQVKGEPLYPKVRIVSDQSGTLFGNGVTIQTDDNCEIADIIPSAKVPFDPLAYFPFERS